MAPNGTFQTLLRRWWSRGPAAWALAWFQSGLGERIAVSGFALWFLSVGLAVWAALGQPPALLEIAAVALLWTFGLCYFLLLGTPPLILPFYALWLALSPKRRAAEERFGAEMDREMAAMKAEPGPSESEAESGEFRLASLGRKPYTPLSECNLPKLHWPLKIAAAALIVALLLDGRVFLAALYLVPPLAWYAFEGSNWVWQRVRSS